MNGRESYNEVSQTHTYRERANTHDKETHTHSCYQMLVDSL